jgi:hypothetical protein
MKHINSINKAKQKMYYENRKIIESVLHPNPKIYDVEILHEHKGKYIFFKAWKDSDPINNRYITIEYNRVLSLCENKQYPLSDDEMNWLIDE